MPTYVYKREDGTTFEIQQKMSDPVLETCPTTGQAVKRMIGAGAGLIFKGDGFYITDYARKRQSNDTSSKSDSESTSESKAESSGKAASTSDTTTTESASSSGTEG